MPGLAALLVVGAIGGRTEISRLLRTLLIWWVGVQWYAVAIFGFLVVWFGTQALNPLFGGTGIHLPALSLALVAAFIAELVLRILLSSEQLAWSDFALPRLQARHSAIVASLVLGVIWAIWHLPLFLVLCLVSGIASQGSRVRPHQQEWSPDLHPHHQRQG
jgi:hypothetical protein